MTAAEEYIRDGLRHNFPNTDGLETALNYRFSDRRLLRQSLQHRSYVGETDDRESNERMEFLGDAILQLVVTDYIYDRYPYLSEGDMARIRARAVSGGALYEVAREMGLGKYLLLGRGEDLEGGRDKVSILADAMEALLAAVYLDGGLENARRVIMFRWVSRISRLAETPEYRDPKSNLYEKMAVWGNKPEYHLSSAGPDHQKVFRAVVTVEGEIMGRGEGGTKKEAQQRAARQALQTMEERADVPH